MHTASLVPATIALLLAGALPAQHRIATVGRVLGPNDASLANAEVTFVGAEPPNGDRFEPADRVLATTDARGRFRVELAPGASYSASAAGPAAQDGSRLVSGMLDACGAGAVLEFKAIHRRSASRLLPSGLDRWQHLGPLRCEIAVAGACVHREPLPQEGPAALPTLPIGSAWLLFVIDGDGEVLHAARIGPQPGDVRFGMPPPREVPVRVVDTAGAAVADAMLYRLVGTGLTAPGTGLVPPRSLAHWRKAGRTAADGTAIVTFPGREDPFAAGGADGPLLMAAKPGFAAAVSGWNGNRIENGRVVQSHGRELQFTLRAGAPFLGRIRGDDGQPLAAAGVQLCAMLPVSTGLGGMRHALAFSTRTDERGAFAFESLPHNLVGARVFVEAARRPAPPPTAVPGRQLQQRVPLAMRAAALLAVDLDQPFDLTFAALAPITLRAQRASGEPARHALAVLQPLPLSAIDADTHSFPLDAGGSATVRVQPGMWSLFVTDGTHFGHAVLEAAGAAEVLLPLQELAVARGRITTDVAATDDVLFQVDLLPRVVRGGDPAARALRLLGNDVTRWLARSTRLEPDRTFALRFLDAPGLQWQATVRGAGGLAQWNLVPGAEPAELQLSRK